MNKYITNNDRRPALPGFYRVIYSNGNTGVEYFDGTTWQVEYSHPVDRWLEESPAQPSILSPEEWLEERHISGDAMIELDHHVPPGQGGAYYIEDLIKDYAAHVAGHVHLETLRRAFSLTREYAGQPARMRKEILNIPLRDVYPAGEKTESNG